MKYDPSPIQREFHALNTTEGLFGGSAGPGKSLALLGDPFDQIVIEHARCERGEIGWGQSTGGAIHFRREMPRLEETIFRAKLLYSQLDTKWHWDAQQHVGTFRSGYRVKFAHLKDQDSFLNYRSSQWTRVYFDELIEHEKDHYFELVSRCRSTDPVLRQSLKVRSASNPGAGWVREYFVDPNPNGREIFVKRFRMPDGTYEERSRIFLPAKLSDNPDKEYVRQYTANLMDKPAHIRAAQLDGNWYFIAGAFFADEWDRDRVVVKPHRIPQGCRRFRTGDWGYKEECVILWWAVMPEGDLLCYRELTLNGRKAKRRHDAREVAVRIKEIEEAHDEWDRNRDCSRLTGWMDTQLWEERGHHGPTMADDMAREGVHWRKASKGRRMAAQQLVRRLKDEGVNGQPGIQFFENCTGCITTIPALGVDPGDPEKPADGGPDHWWAAVSYALSANPLPTGHEQDGFAWDDDMDAAPSSNDWGQYGYGGN